MGSLALHSSRSPSPPPAIDQRPRTQSRPGRPFSRAGAKRPTLPLARVVLALALGGAPVAGLSAQAPQGVPVITLEEARRRSTAVDPTAVAARSEVGAAAWERRAARLDLFTPSITAGTSYSRFSEPFFNFGTGGIGPSATSAPLV